MSKKFTKEEVIQNKKEAIKSLNKMLEYLINDKSMHHLKKAHLVSYWIKDYVKMITFESFMDVSGMTVTTGELCSFLLSKTMP